jgi:enolase 1/2/3
MTIGNRDVAARIVSVRGREVLDSRGWPTLAVEVVADDGVTSAALAPANVASAGPKEAVDIRDGDCDRYWGFGVLGSVRRIEESIWPALAGRNPTHQGEIDRILIELDGTPDKRVLGVGAILAVSMAVARAGAAASGLPLYRHLGGPAANRLPMPMIDILNGGKHAANGVDFEEFMVVPLGAVAFGDAVRMGAETFQALRRILQNRGHRLVVGDLGGFAPNLTSNERAFEVIVEAIEAAGFRPGEDIAIAIDVAAGQFYDADSQTYRLPSTGFGQTIPRPTRNRQDMIGFLGYLIQKYPVVSIEDGVASSDWQGFSDQMNYFGWKVQIVGDDLYATHSALVRRGIAEGASNAMVIRLAQVGTVTEAIQAVDLCRKAGWAFIIADSTADTEDPFTADFAVAMGAAQVKFGCTCRGERIAKYNRLLEIERELGSSATFDNPLKFTPCRKSGDREKASRQNHTRSRT